MISRRLFHKTASLPIYSTAKALAAPSPLAALRKKTGYSITNCKKALQLCENDIEKAESWLNSQAQSQGWDKAAKLQSRATLNGLVGITFSQTHAVIVEVNCETDFVSRNEVFKTLVAKVTESCFNSLPSANSSTPVLKVNFSSEQLGSLPANEGKSTLSDLVALHIGQIGENMSLRHATALCLDGSKMKVACCTHPEQKIGNAILGKYGALVAYEDGAPAADSVELPDGLTMEKLPKQLCQHIIGMNPRSVEKVEGSPSSDEETAMNHQEFVANPEYRVGEILDQVGWKVKSFVRFECGEAL